MSTETFHLRVKEVPPIMKRGQHVLVLVRNAEGNFVLGMKSMYPVGMVRMVGGGVEAGETPIAAALREAHEEIGLVLMPSSLRQLAEVRAVITDQNHNKIIFTTFIFLADNISVAMKPASDLSDIRTLTLAEMKDLIQTYQHLSPEIDPKVCFAWADYGQLYGPIHEIALNAATASSSS